MKKMIYEVLGVKPSRVDELCTKFFTSDTINTDDVVSAIKEADLSTEEKMVLSFALGFMSAVAYEPPEMILKHDKYIH